MSSPMNDSKKPLSKTAQTIQETATQMFAEKGYDGTIMDELAMLTGANKASIYYHFGNKENLYAICLHNLFKTVADAVIEAVEHTEGIEKQLSTFISTFAQQSSAHRQMPAVLMREIASGGVHMPVIARQQMQRLLECFKSLLKQGQEANIFRLVDPLMTHFMIIGSLCFFITSEPMRLAIESETKVDPSLPEATRAISEMVLQGLLKN